MIDVGLGGEVRGGGGGGSRCGLKAINGAFVSNPLHSGMSGSGDAAAADWNGRGG